MRPETAEKLQNEIFQKMSAEEKIKIVSKFFEFGKKLSSLNDRRKNNPIDNKGKKLGGKAVNN